MNPVWAAGQVVFQPFRNYWFTLGLMDPAAMHCVIANAAMHRKALRVSKEDDMIALTHSMYALKSINQRIADAGQNITNEMLGAVLGV
jgi:hypothetical protein